ncbi:envelope-like protein [Trifolium medium]|uniref:Envelope-like protein n=1 Tax=Trifolium medium TaxID=97028 RepID=A0A392NPL1_9FABA|nr:envelope-like protein [Trifolium medium]
MPIAFPTLICDIILAQYPGICTESDVPSRRDSDLSLDYRLFEGTQAADIAAPSAQKPTGAITRQHMIIDLKLVSKALDDKKFLVDRVIHALELEEVAATEDAGVGSSNVPSGAQTNEEDDADVQGENSDDDPSI